MVGFGIAGARVSIHHFFGHCDPTPTWALVSYDEPRRRLVFEFCETDRDVACHDFGDRRMPRLSAEALRRHGLAPMDFVLCIEHTNIVKDPIVQDNLIRLLLGDRGDVLAGNGRR